MATPVLTDAEHFDFTPLAGERLDLFGALLGWSDDIKTGSWRSSLSSGPARYTRLLAHHRGVWTASARSSVPMSEPGTIASWTRSWRNPRAADASALWRASRGLRIDQQLRVPGDAIDVIYFTLRFSETGLRDPRSPRPLRKRPPRARRAPQRPPQARPAVLP